MALLGISKNLDMPRYRQAKSDYERARTEFIENKQEHCSVVTFDDLLKSIWKCEILSLIY